MQMFSLIGWQFRMFAVFPPNSVADTKLIYGYNFVALFINAKSDA